MNLKCINVLFSNTNKRNLCSVRFSSKSPHPFKVELTTKTVIDSFVNNVLYNDGRIAVFNKPSQVARSRAAPEEMSADLYMDDIMKEANLFVPGFENPTIVKFPAKHTSGVLIIASSEEIANKIRKCKARAKDNPDTFDKYLTICQGLPVIKSGNFKLAVTIAKDTNSNRHVRILKDTWSNRDVKLQNVKLFRVAHKVVEEGPLASLCSVALSTPKKNSMRLYFATKLLAPLLGDNQFASRVNDVLGVPMLLDQFSDVANSRNKRLPLAVLKALNLNHNETSLVPQFVHLAQVNLPRYKAGQDLVLSAPIPDTFKWTCQQLQIFNEDLENYDCYNRAQMDSSAENRQ